MSQPTVSIIIPCYRQARFLPSAMETVRRQTYPQIEIVVVNDGSDDNTDAVMQSCGQGVVYAKQTNAGVSAARNAGIAAASGQYVMFMDADDLLHASAIEWMVRAMENRHDRLCVMGYRMFDTDPGQGDDRFLPLGMPALPRLFADNLGPPHAFLCSMQILKRLNGFEAQRIFWGAEDWDLWLRMALSGCELVTLGKIGAYYRRYDGSASTNLERAERATALMLQRAATRIENDPRLHERWGGELKKIRQRIAQAYFDVGYHQARRGAARSAIAAYAQSARCGFSLTSSLLGMVKAMGHAARARIAPPSPLPIAGASLVSE